MSKKLAIVEDNADAARLIARVAQGAGFGADIYESAVVALEAIPAENYSLITLDVSMPVMDGFEFATRIREIAPHIPIVVISALPTTREAVRFLSGGSAALAVAYFQKPVNIAELTDVMRRHGVPTIKGFRLQHNTLTAPDGRAVGLSQREAELVELLINEPDTEIREIVTRLSRGSRLSEKTARTYINRARCKLGVIGLEILHRAGRGYSVV